MKRILLSLVLFFIFQNIHLLAQTDTTYYSKTKQLLLLSYELSYGVSKKDENDYSNNYANRYTKSTHISRIGMTCRINKKNPFTNCLFAFANINYEITTGEIIRSDMHHSVTYFETKPKAGIGFSSENSMFNYKDPVSCGARIYYNILNSDDSILDLQLWLDWRTPFKRLSVRVYANASFGIPLLLEPGISLVYFGIKK